MGTVQHHSADFPRPVADVDEDEIVQVLMPRRLARTFERRCLPVAAQLAGPLEFSEDDVPTFLITVDVRREPGSSAVIRPRTKGERTALLTGYSMALEMVEKDGAAAAREWLRTMLASEERIGGPNERSNELHYHYTTEGDVILHDGKPIAKAIDGNSETAGRLASLANIAERDEAWLDRIGAQFVHRNDE